jgi:hypothetical protein
VGAPNGEGVHKCSGCTEWGHMEKRTIYPTESLHDLFLINKQTEMKGGHRYGWKGGQGILTQC